MILLIFLILSKKNINLNIKTKTKNIIKELIIRAKKLINKTKKELQNNKKIKDIKINIIKNIKKIKIRDIKIKKIKIKNIEIQTMNNKKKNPRKNPWKISKFLMKRNKTMILIIKINKDRQNISKRKIRVIK